MKKKFRPNKIDFDGTIYILDSIVGLFLTAIIFIVIFNQGNATDTNIKIVACAICSLLNIPIVWLSIKMKKRTHERNKELEINPNNQTGISHKILVLDKKRRIINIIMLIIETLSLLHFLI